VPCLLAYATGIDQMMKEPIFPDIFLEAQHEGGFVAFSREYQGAAGQGETEEEAVRDLQESIELLKEVLKEEREKK
jgi:predicted RNase H-like HicB family nuclease